MAIYCVTGRLGSGKSLACIGRMQDGILAGKRIATNLDLHLENMLPAKARKVDAIRLPDKPTVVDLESLGSGNPSMSSARYDENQNGLLILDELGSWLNSREWADKGRQAVIDWLIHSRKKGWDVYFIVQHVNMIDKQIREALVEYLVICRRLDRMRIPFVGGFLKMISAGFITGTLPKMHFGIVRYGTNPDAVVADRWVYLGTDLYEAYDTRQVFTANYAHGVFSYLTPWHLKGRHQKSFLQRLKDRFFPPPLRHAPSQKLSPLMALPPDARWSMARRLIEQGVL